MRRFQDETDKHHFRGNCNHSAGRRPGFHVRAFRSRADCINVLRTREHGRGAGADKHVQPCHNNGMALGDYSACHMLICGQIRAPRQQEEKIDFTYELSRKDFNGFLKILRND